MPTYEEALVYLGIDYADDSVIKQNVERCLATAHKTLLSSVGEDVETYLLGDERVKELVLIYTEDLYSQRGISAKVSGATRTLVGTMELQLRLALRTAKEAASV